MMDHKERLQAMVSPGQQTWDLSPNDVSAIKWALAEIERLEQFASDAQRAYAGICETLDESGKRRLALLHHCEVVLAAYDSARRDGETKVWNGAAVDAMRATVKAERAKS